MTRFYGLTGGIGSGKSTVASIFSDHGVPTLDLDQVGKTLINTDPSIVDELCQTFGLRILNQDSSLNRKALAEVAFQSDANTSKLNKIMHTRIRSFEQQWRNKQTNEIAVIEASVLIESGNVDRMHALIVVISDFELRKQRVINRGKQSEYAFTQIVKRQCEDEERLTYADYIIKNNASLEILKATTIKLLQQLSN